MGQNYKFIFPRWVKKLTKLQINAERWLQKLIITCEIWGINGALAGM